MIWQIFVVILCLWFIQLMWKRRKIYYLSWKVRNDEMIAYPLLGHAYIFFGNDEDRMTAFRQLDNIAFKNKGSNKGLTKVWIGPQLFLVIVEPKYLDTIIKSCLEKDDIVKFIKELIGQGSIFAPVSIWRPRRKVTAPTFSQKNLNQFVRIFSEQSKIMAKCLEREANKGTFSLWRYITSYNMDSICESALGIKLNAQITSQQDFQCAFEHLCEKASSRVCIPPVIQEIYKYLPSYHEYYEKHINYIRNFVDKIIRNKRQEIQEKQHLNKTNGLKEESTLKSFLEMYINKSGGESGFTNSELREETLVLMLAGTDTSAVGMAFTSLMLAMHPHVQEKAYEEIQIVLGDPDRPITAEDLPRLKYLEMVVKESLRLYPPVPIITRKLDKDVTLSNGLKLYKDTSLIISIWGLHRNPDYWGSDADQFRPERFIDSAPEHPAAFMPFSTGPRSCIGYQYAMMSMKTLLANLIRHYKLLPPASGLTLPLRVKFDIMMKHVDNFEIQLEKRL